jgi:hypothetical protein
MSGIVMIFDSSQLSRADVRSLIDENCVIALENQARAHGGKHPNFATLESLDVAGNVRYASAGVRSEEIDGEEGLCDRTLLRVECRRSNPSIVIVIGREGCKEDGGHEVEEIAREEEEVGEEGHAFAGGEDRGRPES